MCCSQNDVYTLCIPVNWNLLIIPYRLNIPRYFNILSKTYHIGCSFDIIAEFINVCVCVLFFGNQCSYF